MGGVKTVKKNNPYQSRPRNHALFLLAGLLILMFRVRSGRIQEQGASNLGAPAAVETSTIAVTPTDNKALAPMRSGLLLSRAGDGHGFWTGFMLVERDRPELQPLFRTPFGDGRISDESFTDIAPGAHALTWWSLGRASRASVPVITRIKLEGATTNVHSLEVTPSQAVSCASIAEGKACAIALKKDSYWQLAISSQDRGEI